jgi:tripartite-type tricarboxylate transporter receptor subunit TctC
LTRCGSLLPALRRLALIATLVALGCAGATRAQEPAPFFKGKMISLLIGFGAGGEDDLWARTIAHYYGKYIPGDPAIVPQNSPGSGSLSLANRLYNTAPDDGTVIGMINRGIPFEPLLGGKETQFDAQKFNWIGSPGRDTTVCASRKDAAVKSLADLNDKELAVGATGSGADTAIYPQFLAALLGMKFKVIMGYQGSHEVQLAMERNEVQGICVNYDSLERGTLARAQAINILLQASLEPDPRLGGVPSALDFASAPEERQALQLFFARASIGRPIVAPPGVPAARIALLRDALDSTLRDPNFLEDAKKQDLNVVPLPGDKLADIIAKAYTTPPEIVRRTLAAMGRG